jgi:DNA polymerase delta subunit 1
VYPSIPWLAQLITLHNGHIHLQAYEKSEDPIYVLENNIPIDPQYYLENQLSKPLLRIFDPILKNASRELLHGSHTRSVSISTPSNSGIMKFAKKRASCIGCRTPITYATCYTVFDLLGSK